MKAIEIAEHGGPDVLRMVDRDQPICGPTDILIKVEAAGVNRPDCLQRAGLYAPPKHASPHLGLEVAGIIVAMGLEAGDDILGLQIGDAVTALTPGGGYAEYCITDYRHALPIPKGLSMVEAASLPENYFTVWENVFRRGQLEAVETLLVHGGSSGIGSAAIQLAKARGASVIATTGSQAKCAFCTEIGADLAINYCQTDFVEATKDFTHGKGADVILDMVGGDYIHRNYQAASLEGRIVQIAFLSGAKIDIDYTLLMTKRLTHTGSTLRPQSVEAKAALAKNLQKEIWPLFASQKIKPVVRHVMPLEDAAKAHHLMESGKLIGKIVLTL